MNKSKQVVNRFAAKNNNNNKKTFEIRIPRLILRNLNFKLKEDELKSSLEKYGTVKDLKLPKKADGSPCGYGFVSYASKTEAIEAMKNINNMKEKLLGTRVVVDWCLPKDVYLKSRDEKAKSNENESEPIAEAQTAKKRKASESEDDGDHDDDDYDSEGDDKDESDENDDKSDIQSGSDNDDENEDDEDGTDDEDADEDEKDNKKKTPKLTDKMKENIKEGTKDVQEKRTIFVRNISYDTKEDDLKEAFSKYGEIKYCKLCYDRDFERPKGTAFIQFVEADGALNACGESNILEIDSRKIQIDLAISRKQINDIIVDKKTKIPEDRRNITLAKEGFIDPKTSEGQRLSKSDLNMRAKIEAANSAKLKLLHYFVSTTRLSVHNLPVKCTDSELKKVFLNVFKDDKDARIVECRIMRDLKRVNSEGIAKSRGYGFVQFTKFEHARKALHAINNNPNVFDDKKTRLIVQFSIEDMRALKKKERRVEKEVHKRERNDGHGHNKALNKPKAAKKNKKNDPQDDLDENKKREKNLLRLNILEKKLNKRKLKDAKTQDNGEPIGRTAKPVAKPNNANSIDKIMQMRNNKRMKNKRKRENLNRKLNSQKGDKVDNLIDKYIKDKNKPKQKKWYDK